MKRRKIGVRSLKNDASRILNEVRERRAEYLVTNRGEPVAVLRPVEEADRQLDRAAHVEAIMKRMRATAKRVSRLSSGESAASVVSRQRR